jgi:hypothetical protein
VKVSKQKWWPEIGMWFVWRRLLDGEGRERKQVTKMALRLYIPKFLEYPAKKDRNVRLGIICVQTEDRRRCQNFVLDGICLRSLAHIMYLQGMQMMVAGSTQVELSPNDLLHCSLIGRMLELWMFLEWRLLP